MADLDGDRLKGLVRGALATNTSTSNNRADQLAVKRWGPTCQVTLAVNAAFGQTTINPRLDRPVRVTAIRGCQTAAQATNASDGRTYTVKYDDGAGGASTSVGSFTTIAGTAVTANQAFNFTMTNSAPVDIVAAKRLFLVDTEAHAAVAANAATLFCTIEYEET